MTSPSTAAAGRLLEMISAGKSASSVNIGAISILILAALVSAYAINELVLYLASSTFLK